MDGIGDHRGQQMRDAVIDRQFQHLGIDHDQPALLGRHLVEQRQDHGVDAHRLARAGGAGDEQMRHAGEIGDDRLAANGLAEADRQLALHLFEVGRGQHFAEIDGLADLVGQLDADGIAAWNHRDAGRNGAHRAGDVVGERNDAARLDAGGGLEFIERHDRTGAHIDDVALDAEIVQHAFETARHRLEALGRMLGARALVLGSARRLNGGSSKPCGSSSSEPWASRAARAPGCGRGAGAATRGDGVGAEAC